MNQSSHNVHADTALKRVTLAFTLTALVSMFAGFLFGPLQALNYAGVDVYQYLPLKSYYQGLTLHGVLLALVFTSFMISGWLLYIPACSLQMQPNLAWSWSAFIIMLAGTVMAGAAMLTDSATVLYTLYPPLMGHWSFYVGLALAVIGTLMIAGQVIWMRHCWLREHPGEPTPMPAYISVVTWIMWSLASVGLVVGVVFFLIPASLGWTSGVDPQLFRSLFWYTGHPIVYFWLLPVYVSWYAMLPRQAGGRLLSDPLARLVFLLFLMFSIPVGFHHQYSDPAIPVSWKLVHNINTMFVAIPSLITVFTLAASLEDGGRARGGRGWIGWFFALPWKAPAFNGQLLAMLTFIFGGAGGIILASFHLNAIVHNTAFIPGHFHLTVGTAVTLSFMAIAYWLLPHLTGRPLKSTTLALTSNWLWFAGMMLMGTGMHWMGVLGVPRRTHVSHMAMSWTESFGDMPLQMLMTGVGGVCAFMGGLLFFVVIGRLLLSRESHAAEIGVPFADYISGPRDANGAVKKSVRWMDRLSFWTLMTAILILIAYAPSLFTQFSSMTPVSGMRLW